MVSTVTALVPTVVMAVAQTAAITVLAVLALVVEPGNTTCRLLVAVVVVVVLSSSRRRSRSGFRGVAGGRSSDAGMETAQRGWRGDGDREGGVAGW